MVAVPLGRGGSGHGNGARPVAAQPLSLSDVLSGARGTPVGTGSGCPPPAGPGDSDPTGGRARLGGGRTPSGAGGKRGGGAGRKTGGGAACPAPGGGAPPTAAPPPAMGGKTGTGTGGTATGAGAAATTGSGAGAGAVAGAGAGGGGGGAVLWLQAASHRLAASTIAAARVAKVILRHIVSSPGCEATAAVAVQPLRPQGDNPFPRQRSRSLHDGRPPRNRPPGAAAARGGSFAQRPAARRHQHRSRP